MNVITESSAKSVPVFVFPTVLNFYLDLRQSHKQILTIYNPYSFAIRYKVLCTDPNKYTVNDSEGSVASSCCVDLVVRHIVPLESYCDIIDKFKVIMMDHVTKQVLGKRIISAKLSHRQNAGDFGNEHVDDFKPLPMSESELSSEKKSIQFPMPTSQTVRNDQNNFVAMLLGAICIGILCLPTYVSETSSKSSMLLFPSYLHIDFSMKLVCSYVLGLVTVLLLRY